MPQSNETYVPQLLRLCSRAQELQLLKLIPPKPHTPQEKSLQREDCPPQLESSPWSLQENETTKTQHGQKEINIILKSC